MGYGPKNVQVALYCLIKRIFTFYFIQMHLKKNNLLCIDALFRTLTTVAVVAVFFAAICCDFGQHFLLHFRRRKKWGGKMQQHKQQDGRPTLRLQRRFCSADRCATLLCSMCTPTLTPSPSPSSRPNGGGDDWKDCNNQLPITAMQHSPSQSPD